MTTVYADADALHALRRAIITFAGREQDVLGEARLALARTWDALADAESNWEQQGEEIAYRLDECYAEAEEAASMGTWLDCSALEDALHYAEQRLAAIRRQQHEVETAARTYHRAARRVQQSIEQEIPRAANYLERRAHAIEAACALEVATSLPAAAAVALQIGMPGVMDVIAGAAARSQGQLSRLMGLEGEELVASLLSKRYGLKPLPFDPPAQGFDRVFSAPGLPLIVAEVKVNRDGKLRLGQPDSGEQGSPAWIAAQAERMIDPGSAAYSPANARIALLVDQLGVENVPAVTLVVNRSTATADFYLRGRDGAWQLLESNITLSAGESE